MDIEDALKEGAEVTITLRGAPACPRVIIECTGNRLELLPSDRDYPHSPRQVLSEILSGCLALWNMPTLEEEMYSALQWADDQHCYHAGPIPSVMKRYREHARTRA